MDWYQWLGIAITIYLALFGFTIMTGTTLAKKIDRIASELHGRVNDSMTKEAFRDFKADRANDHAEIWRTVNEQREKLASFTADLAGIKQQLVSVANVLVDIKSEVAAVHKAIDGRRGAD